jgi:hypothetical protein
MIIVSEEEFFAYVGGPRNVHPRAEENFSSWEIVSTRELVGRSTPGWKNPGGPRTYMLTEAAAASIERHSTCIYRCLIHFEDEPCPECRSLIAAGL